MEAQPEYWRSSATAALGDTDTDPTLSIPGDVFFVANNAGTIFAINPTTAATLKSVAGGDGAIISFPIALGLTSPYTVIFSGQTAVHAMKYDKTANTFTSLWSTTISGPSAPIGFTGGAKVYVGSADGKIHELDAVTGVDGKQRTANTGQPGIVGDPALDTCAFSNLHIDQRPARVWLYVSVLSGDERGIELMYTEKRGPSEARLGHGSTGLRCFMPGGRLLSLSNGNDFGQWRRRKSATAHGCDHFVLRRWRGRLHAGNFV